MADIAIQWLVFDLGGVLIDVAPAHVTLAKLAEASNTPVARLRGPLREQFTQRPFSLAERFQAGEVEERVFLRELDALLEQPLGPDELRRHLEQMLLGVIESTARLLPALARQVGIACYSNTNVVHWRHALERFGFFEHIAERMASHEVGVAKPDPRAFDYAQKRLQAPPRACLLIDDRRINVAAARAAGWQALHFTDADSLAAQLRACHIEVG